MKALILDPEERARQQLREAFTAAGAQVTAVDSVAAAAEALGATGAELALVVVDVASLVSLGEVAATPVDPAAERPGPSPVLLVTASEAELPEALSALAAGAFDVLPRPLDAEACARAAWRACDHQRATVERARIEHDLAERRAQLVREQQELADEVEAQPALERQAALRGEKICSTLATRLDGLPERLDVAAQLLDDPITRAAVADAAFAARQGHRMVHDLLDVDRAERAPLPVSRRTTDVKRFLDNMLASVARIATDYDARVDLDCPSDAGACDTDPELLGRALHNLLDAALRRGRRGRVHLGVVATVLEVRFTISDHAPAPPDRVLATLFERKNRLESGTIQRAAGLAFCRAAAEALSGSLSVEALTSGGLSLSLSLPRRHQGGGPREASVKRVA